jgi:hypothetical protein
MLIPANPRDPADAIAFALRFEERRRVHQAEEYMAAIAAERVVRHLERAGFVIMKRPPIGGHAPLGRGFEGYLPFFAQRVLTSLWPVKAKRRPAVPLCERRDTPPPMTGCLRR